MPKTNKGANRISHGMAPMLPGDAQTWNTAAGAAYMGEDSCTKCHVQSRTDLQEAIEEWQGDATAAATSAYAAINAAKTRTEFVATDPNSAGYILVGRATWNYKAWQNDLSGGVHNPEYIVDGLDKGKELAKSVGGSLTISAPPSVLPGVNLFISGKATNGDGTAAAGATIKLFANGAAYGTNPLASTVKATDNGTFSFLVQQTDATSYQVKWVRSGDARTDLASNSVTVNRALYSSTTTVKKSASEIKVNKEIKITGTVTSSGPDKPTGSVKVSYRLGSGSWKYWTRPLDANGNYSKKFTPTKTGTWYFKSQYLGSATVATSKSGEVHTHVKK